MSFFVAGFPFKPGVFILSRGKASRIDGWGTTLAGVS